MTEMVPIEVEIDPEKLSNQLTCLEYPEFVNTFENIKDKLRLSEASDGRKFTYKPFIEGSERLKINSNAQKRNLLIFKVKKDSNGTVKKANLIGISQKCHVFRELFDFTAESEHENGLQQSFKAASETFDEKDIDSIANIVSNSGIDWNNFTIPPFKFTHINLPLSSRDIRSNLKVSQKEDVINQERSWNISFNEPEVPMKPADDCISRARNVPQTHIDAVSKIFDERPIVSKLYLLNRIKDASIIANLRQILPLLGFHWKNGPWHLLWNKYGIDPRKDSKYRFYQSVELRNKMFAKELRRGKFIGANIQDESSLTSTEPSNYSFDGERLILNYLTYQYIDLTYQPLQEIVNYPISKRSEVSDKEGWYPDGTTKRLRDIMKQRWFELLRSMDLSTLPQNKLEEILEITGPATSSSTIGADWNSLSKSSKSRKIEVESDEEFAEEESDYEIFDY